MEFLPNNSHSLIEQKIKSLRIRSSVSQHSYSLWSNQYRQMVKIHLAFKNIKELSCITLFLFSPGFSPTSQQWGSTLCEMTVNALERRFKCPSKASDNYLSQKQDVRLGRLMMWSRMVIPMVLREHKHQSFNKYMVSIGLQTGWEKKEKKILAVRKLPKFCWHINMHVP